MATPAHCLFCFETLAANLERHDAPQLHTVQETWEQYVESQTQPVDAGEEEDEDDNESEGMQDDADVTPRYPRRAVASHRLTVPSPSSGSSSSTPSSMSLSSSRTPASSTNSSSTSFFSFARRNRTQQTRRDDATPLFVTWSAISKTARKSLRGCIGTFEAQELESGLKSYALTSALDDTRFMPIAKRELPGLEVAVTLLTDFEAASTPTSWDLGTHGLRISFTYHSRRYGATYLPDVPLEQGWTKEETLISLMRKAGWTGKEHEWQKVGDLKVTRYQGKRVTVSYDEWMAWRQWVEKRGAL